ncbi:hypothetical protein KI387_029466, partial [Taxus chinensis]
QFFSITVSCQTQSFRKWLKACLIVVVIILLQLLLLEKHLEKRIEQRNGKRL